MSGPSLKKVDAHSSIHDAALAEAGELTGLLKICLDRGDMERAAQVAEVSVEHWESRTLQHAQSEEEGLYQDAVTENRVLEEIVCQLTRDHHLMRRIVEEIKDHLLTGNVNERTVSLFESLIIIDEIHNKDEMEKLLGQL